MKKLILGLAGVVIMAFVVVLFVNAQNAPQEVKKPATTKESTMDCGKCPSAGTSAACAPATEAKAVTAAKSGPATNTSKTSEVKPAASACCPAAPKK